MEIKIYGLLLCLLLAACSKDEKIDYIPDVELDYVLPQGGNSAADKRIVEFNEKYGSYILYEFDQKDFEWTQVEDSKLKGIYKYTPADLDYVDEMLDLLDEIWFFDFYPDDFLRLTTPYRVFLTATLDWSYYGYPISEFTRTGENQIAISCCSDTLTKLSKETKLEFKISLQRALWLNWLRNGLISIPKEFYAVSDYSSVADIDPSSHNYAAKRGFVRDGYGNDWYVRNNWITGRLIETDDSAAFIGGMVTRSSEEWKVDLEYPLVRKKYDILRKWIQEKYGFDIQLVGDALY